RGDLSQAAVIPGIRRQTQQGRITSPSAPGSTSHSETNARDGWETEVVGIMSTAKKRRGSTEIGLILRRGRQVGALLPARHKARLGFALLVIVAVSSCNTAIPLLLGRLVDGVHRGGEAGLFREALTWIALGTLGLLAGTYVVREALNVLRRYLVE